MRAFMILAALIGGVSGLAFPDTRNPKPDTPSRLSARLVRVVDGDTLRLDIHLGADVTLRNQAVRILGIDAPELHGPERPRGLAARDALQSKIENRQLTIELHGKDKYGRWLADVFVGEENIALWMLRQRLARPYQIGRRAPESPQDTALEAAPCPSPSRAEESL